MSNKAFLTADWQSSNVPSYSIAVILSFKVEICCSCINEIFFDGYKIITLMPLILWNAFATAAPVSPDVATKIVISLEYPF